MNGMSIARMMEFTFRYVQDRAPRNGFIRVHSGLLKNRLILAFKPLGTVKGSVNNSRCFFTVREMVFGNCSRTSFSLAFSTVNGSDFCISRVI